MYTIGVNKIPPNFDTLFVTPLWAWVIQQFKGLCTWRLYGSLAARG